MPEPFVGKIAHVGDRDVDALVFSAFDESGEAVVVLPNVDELPMIDFAD